MTQALVVLLSLWGLAFLGGDFLCEKAPGPDCAGAVSLWPAFTRALPASEGDSPLTFMAPDAPLSRIDRPPIHLPHT